MVVFASACKQAHSLYTFCDLYTFTRTRRSDEDGRDSSSFGNADGEHRVRRIAERAAATSTISQYGNESAYEVYAFNGREPPLE